MDKQEYIEAFTSDVLVVMRGGEVVRIMVNNPGAQAVVLDLGDGDNAHPPRIIHYGPAELLFDPLEVEAYINEFMQKSGAALEEKKPEWVKEFEAIHRGVEEVLQEDPVVKEVKVDDQGNVYPETGKGR